jgi:hypothetical protein
MVHNNKTFVRYEVPNMNTMLNTHHESMYAIKHTGVPHYSKQTDSSSGAIVFHLQIMLIFKLILTLTNIL